MPSEYMREENVQQIVRFQEKKCCLSLFCVYKKSLGSDSSHVLPDLKDLYNQCSQPENSYRSELRGTRGIWFTVTLNKGRGFDNMTLSFLNLHMECFRTKNRGRCVPFNSMKLNHASIFQQKTFPQHQPLFFMNF